MGPRNLFPPGFGVPPPVDNELELTFRDPAGELRLAAGCALRRIRPSAAEETRAFLASPLRRSLEQSGDLIPSRIAEPGSHPWIAAGEFWLEHPRIDPISYPWEWTTAQWRAAAELTLRVASQAIDAGWTLKDATPLNILFAGPHPILVDVLSFERRDPHSSVWLAYGQFVRTFLLPLVAARYLNWPLQATLFARDGYEPRQIYDALPRWRRLNPNLLDVVTLATLFERPGATARRFEEDSIHHRSRSRRGTSSKSASRASASRFVTRPASAATANGAATNKLPATIRPPTSKKNSNSSRACSRDVDPNAFSISAPTLALIRCWLPMPARRVVALDSDSAALEATLAHRPEPEQAHHGSGCRHRPPHARGGMA